LALELKESSQFPKEKNISGKVFFEFTFHDVPIQAPPPPADEPTQAGKAVCFIGFRIFEFRIFRVSRFLRF
jgi:hypothetical protein